jgi:hypothetical protein
MVDYLLFKYSGTQTETKCCGEKKEGKHSTKKKQLFLRNFTLEFLFIFSFFNCPNWILKLEIPSSNYEIRMRNLLQLLDLTTNDSIGALSLSE